MEQSTQEIVDFLVKTLWEYYTTNGNFDNIFTKTPNLEIEQLANHIFKHKIVLDTTTLLQKFLTYAVQKTWIMIGVQLKSTDVRRQIYMEGGHLEIILRKVFDCEQKKNNALGVQ